MGGKKTQVDLEQLKQEIPQLNPDKQLYKILKDGLSKLGYWRQRQRGDPKRGFKKGWGKNRENQ